MQITISVSHTFEDATLFAAFAPELKALLNKFFSGAGSLPPVPETRGMTPRERANDIAPPAVSPPTPEQPAPILEASGGGGGSAPSRFELALERAAQVDVLPSGDDTTEFPAPNAELQELMVPGNLVPPKRRRRTKAEMAAARATGAVAPLPNAGSFGGPATTSAPVPATEPDPFDPFNPASTPAAKAGAAPAPKQSAPAAGNVTHADVKAAFAPVLMHDDSEPYVLEILGRFGIGKVNESIDKPELWAPLVDAFTKLQRQLGVAA